MGQKGAKRSILLSLIVQAKPGLHTVVKIAGTCMRPLLKVFQSSPCIGFRSLLRQIAITKNIYHNMKNFALNCS